MRHGVTAVQQPPADKAAMRKLMDVARAAHEARIWPEIDNPTADQRADMPHAVECHGLTVHDLGEALADELWDRRLWCREHCRDAFGVEPVWDRAEGRDVGRRFRFSDQTDAAMFRLSWC